MANILGISGSPKEKGNTAFAVNYALGLLKEKHETRYVSLADKHIFPCKACGACSASSKCPMNDDMQELYNLLRWCDVLILGSPVFMGMVSGQLKVLMDRCVVLRPDYSRPYEMEGKIGCGIACGWFRNGGQEGTLQNMHTFFLQQNMVVINDGSPYSHVGAAIVENAEKDELGLQTIEGMVRNIEKELSRRKE